MKECRIKEYQESLKNLLYCTGLRTAILTGVFGLGGTLLGSYSAYHYQTSLLKMQLNADSEREKRQSIIFEYTQIKHKFRDSIHEFIKSSCHMASGIQSGYLLNHDSSIQEANFKEKYNQFTYAFETLYWFVKAYGHKEIELKVKDNVALIVNLILEDGMAKKNTNMRIPFNIYRGQLRTNYDNLISFADEKLSKELK